MGNAHASEYAIDSICNFYHSYDVLRLDENKSIQGPVVDGQITYLDSVFENYNPLENRYAFINTEDSNYTMIVPTNEAWKRAKNAILPFYNYVDQFTFIESPQSSTALQHEEEVELSNGGAYWRDSMVHHNLMESLFYNNNLFDNVKLKNHKTGQKLGVDSLMTVDWGKMYTEDAEALFVGTTRVDKSNGAMYITDDSLRMHPWTIWNPIINIEGEYSNFLAAVVNGSTMPHNGIIAAAQNPAVPGRLSNNGYLEANASSNNTNPELNFYLRNVRSTTYVIYGVFAPSNITNVYDTAPKGNFVRVAVGFNNEKGGISKNPTRLGDFETSAEKIDTVCFGEVTFPICYAGTDYAPYLRITGRVTPTTASQYDRTIRLDRIFLVPKEMDDYLKAHPDYKYDDPSQGNVVIIVGRS